MNKCQVLDRHAAGAPPDAWDARGVLDAQRRRVLSGVTLCFSRLAPSDAEALARLAARFGGAVSDAPGPGVTHVVAAADGTAKVLWARDAGRFVVSPAWLECSCVLGAKASEARFSLAY